MAISPTIAALVLAVLGGAGGYQQTEHKIPKTVIGLALGGAVGYFGSNFLNEQQQDSSALDEDDQAETKEIAEQVVAAMTEQPNSEAAKLAAEKAKKEADTLTESTKKHKLKQRLLKELKLNRL